MYSYQSFESGLWTVGFYTPQGKWIAESDHNSSAAAAARVHWLNGGKEPQGYSWEGEPAISCYRVIDKEVSNAQTNQE